MLQALSLSSAHSFLILREHICELDNFCWCQIGGKWPTHFKWHSYYLRIKVIFPFVWSRRFWNDLQSRFGLILTAVRVCPKQATNCLSTKLTFVTLNDANIFPVPPYHSIYVILNVHYTNMPSQLCLENYLSHSS